MYTNELWHYGVARRSGRYPWGSGEEPYQRGTAFTKQYEEYKSKGFNEKQIADAMGYSIKELRERKSLDKSEIRQSDLAFIIKLKDKGYSQVAIAERMGKNESYVRSLLNPVAKERMTKTNNIADILKEAADSNMYIDIGPGTSNLLGVSETRLKTAVRKLEDQGYSTNTINIEQVGNPGKYTTINVLSKGNPSKKEIYENRENIALVTGKKSYDGGRTFLGIEKPTSIDSSRIYVKYESDKDGVIELRRGVEDLSLGGSNYAQVRIAVNGDHYMKGMAIYSDTVPDGYDVVYNSHRKTGTPLFTQDKTYDAQETVFKKMKKDPDNPFGTTLKMEDGIIVGQHHYTDKNGEDKLSPINIVKDQGDWNKWSVTLASQFLSKQPIQLVHQQLTKTYKEKETEFKELKALTNPEVKRELLNSFADDCDASAVHLKAAGLPRQASKVILPLTDIADDEIYAPSFRDGEEVILVRYPHEGTFEIPRLTVNNKNKSGEKMIGNTGIDAVGISPTAASQLSGADFDGDTVVVIPTEGQKLISKPYLDDLKGFDPQESYPYHEGMKILGENRKQTEMGIISNLITDMTLIGAPSDELARATKHSMVIIDATKHKLDYQQSFVDNGITELRLKYQGKASGGAATLISRSKGEKHITKREEITSPYKMTEEEKERYYQGEKIYRDTPEYYTNKSGKEIERTITVTNMAYTDDARTLLSNNGKGTPKEIEYANYANKMKAMANEARKEALTVVPSKVNSSAKEIYANEVQSLNDKLNIAIQNKPYERQAQIFADIQVKAKKADNPDMDKDEIKKIKQQSLAEGRRRMGANKSDSAVVITENEWDAIQAGAISSSKLQEILKNTNMDDVKKLATPRENNALSDAQIAKINSLSKSGKYTLSEIADAMGLSVSSVNKYLQ